MQTNKYYRKLSKENISLIPKLRELSSYKDLILIFVKRDFISKYKQTVLGPAWAVIRPLFTTLVFTFIFGNMAGLADCGTVPSFLFFMCGNVCWSLFADELKSISSTFLNNTHILSKVYFPRLVVPISCSITQLISFGIQLSMFLIFYVIFMFVPGFDYSPSWMIFLFPVLLLQLMILALGAGLIVSSATIKYRDLNMALDFIVQLWMYGTPVAYSLSVFGNHWVGKLVKINPMTSIIESLKVAFLGSQAGSFSLTYFFMSWVMTLIIFAIGLLCFNKVERTFADII